jgi:hypothetical protein
MVLKVEVATLRFRFAPKVSLKKEIDLRFGKNLLLVLRFE